MYGKLMRFGVLMLALGMALSACSGTSGKQEETAAEKTGSVATKVVRDQFGEVTVPVQPKNMLVLDSIYAECLIEMGVTPQLVSFVPEIEPEYREPYFNDHGVKRIAAEQYQYNYEQLLQLAPDMILLRGAGLEKDAYDDLTKIAPTVALDSNSEIEDAIPKLADIFDKKEEGSKVLAEYREKAGQTREKIAAAIGGKTVMVLRVEHNRYRYMGAKSSDSSAFFYQTLGLNSPEAIKDSTDWFNQFSLEILPEINPDFIFLEDRVLVGYDTTKSMKELKESKVWNGLEAVKNDRVFPLKTNDFTVGVGPVGSVRLMDYIAEKLAP